jgi:hypothetical protein
MDQVMGALLSLLVTLASVLGIWTAVSFASAPVLVWSMRSQARANARRTAAARRADWIARR